MQYGLQASGGSPMSRMMASWNDYAFRIIGPLCEESVPWYQHEEDIE